MVHIIPRDEWGARPYEKRELVTEPVKHVFCDYTRSDPCFTFEETVKYLRGKQDKDLATKRKDIRYSFVIASDGSVYEGRGWGVLPYLKPTLRKDYTPFVYIGLIWNRDTNRGYCPPVMVQIQQALIKQGIDANYIVKDHEHYILYY